MTSGDHRIGVAAIQTILRNINGRGVVAETSIPCTAAPLGITPDRVMLLPMMLDVPFSPLKLAIARMVFMATTETSKVTTLFENVRLSR